MNYNIFIVGLFGAVTKVVRCRFGVMLYELLCHKRPWENVKNVRICVEVCNGNRPAVDPEANARAPPQFVDLMHRCWAQDAAERPEFATVLGQLGELCEASRAYGESSMCTLDVELAQDARLSVEMGNDGDQERLEQLKASLLDNAL